MTTDKDLEEFLRWYEHSGHPLEARVAAALRRRGLSTEQPSHYVDPATGKLRDLDVQAYRSCRADNVMLELRVAIEVKGHGAMLGVVGGDGGPSPAPPFQVTRAGREVLRRDREWAAGLFPSTDADGTGVVCQIKNDGHRAIQALDQATSAAVGIATALRNRLSGVAATIVYPIVAWRGPICRVIEGEKPCAEDVESARIRWRDHNAGVCDVLLIRLSALERWLDTWLEQAWSAVENAAQTATELQANSASYIARRLSQLQSQALIDAVGEFAPGSHRALPRR